MSSDEIGIVKHPDDDIVTKENKRKLRECVEIYEKKPILKCEKKMLEAMESCRDAVKPK
jgi:hypothetical protein